MTVPRTFVCTVHIATEPFWSATQPRFVRAHLPGAVLVAAIEPGIDARHFDDAHPLDGAHRHKLDALGRRVVDHVADSDEDVLIFLDGDAFPIRPLPRRLPALLRSAPLAAICREENDEDYPHPSFCATTVGFWKSVGATWEVSTEPGAPTNELGGGRLRDLLRAQGIEWRRLRRSNRFNPHPVLFGVYDGLIYHQGAGFRRPVTAVDRAASGLGAHLDLIAGHNEMLSALFKRLIGRSADFHELLTG